ncbi:unnamed protein product [Closterium sp. NIES-65]|nr:unnamed protein product [Closterium sp. NIES-65]
MAVPVGNLQPKASAPPAFDAVMAETGGPIPSVSDLLSDDGPQSPLAKKVCTREASSSAQPVPIQPSQPDAGLDDITLNAADTSSAPLPMLNGPHQRLRCNRGIVGVVDSLICDTLNLVTIIFPDSLTESHRSKIVNRVRLGLRPAQFPHFGRVPNFESSAGEILRLPRRSYIRHIFQLPTRDDARCFRRVFPMTYTANGVLVELKVSDDPEPSFTAAKARGDPHLVLRNVPLGYSLEGIRRLLTTSLREGERRWLSEVRSFHRVHDPYEEVSLPQMMGIPIADYEDQLFDRIPAIIWLPDVTAPIILNISCHECEICTSNHRSRDHACFAAAQRS